MALPMSKQSYSNLFFGYVKRLAEEMKRQGMKRRLAALAYAEYELAPENFELPDNVDVCVAQLRGPVIQVDPRIYDFEKKHIDAWSRLVDGRRERLAVWNYWAYPNGFSNAPMLAPHTASRWFRENVDKVSGMFIDGRAPDFKNGKGYRQLTAILLLVWHRLMWDPNTDVDAFLNRFYRDMFGPAEAPMKAFFDLEIDRWENTRWSEVPQNSYVKEKLIHEENYPPKVVEKLQALLRKAKKLAPEGSLYRKRGGLVRPNPPTIL